MQTGVNKVVFADDLADRDRITQMFANRRQRDDYKRYRGDEIELGNGKGRQSEPRRLMNRGEVDEGVGGTDETDDQGKEISGDKPDENRDDREEPFQEEIRHDREGQGHHRHGEHQKVVIA